MHGLDTYMWQLIVCRWFRDRMFDVTLSSLRIKAPVRLPDLLNRTKDDFCDSNGSDHTQC